MATYSSIKYNFTPPTATTSAQVGAGAMTLIKTIDASSSANIQFIHGSSDVVMDNTYRTYIFKLIDIHPASHVGTEFNASTDSGSNYNATKTTSTTSAYHPEGGGGSSYYYIESGDRNQASSNQFLSGAVYTDNDSNVGGILYLFNPSGTTFAKHFYWETQRMDYAGGAPYTNRWLGAGYLNTTSAINAVRFQMESGNMDAGTIKMYGIA